MMVEIGVLQRMSVFLGHPVYSLSVTLFALILTTGAGSLLSDARPIRTRRAFFLWAVATSAYVFSLRYWLPPVLLAIESEPRLCLGLPGPTSSAKRYPGPPRPVPSGSPPWTMKSAITL